MSVGGGKQGASGRGCEALTFGAAPAAARAEAVDLDAVVDDLVVRRLAHAGEHRLDVGEVDVLRGAAAEADEVMVVRLVAGAVTDRAVAQDDAADEALVEQQLQRAGPGRPAARGP